MIIAVDFDGTIVRHRYPKIGENSPSLPRLLGCSYARDIDSFSGRFREGKLLDEAIEWCRDRGVEFYAINRDFPRKMPREVASLVSSRPTSSSMTVASVVYPTGARSITASALGKRWRALGIS